MSVVFDPLLPIPVVLVIGLLLFAGTTWTYFTVGARLDKVRNALLLIFRLTAVALVLVILLQPSRRTEIPMRKIPKVLLVALDTSRSMNQRDAAKLSRLQAGKDLLHDAKLFESREEQTPVRIFQFNEDAAEAGRTGLGLLKADGTTTRFHTSISTMLDSAASGEAISALVLLSDGHDFEMANVAKTATLAKSRRVPIYAVPIGESGIVRDASVRIASFSPYTYVKQRSRIAANIRLIGCEHEELTVELLRGDRVIKSTQINAGEAGELPVEFEVTEPQVGQYEYEIRVRPLQAENDTRNNNAITFLNVIDQQIRVLMLEGAPYWDTTFLQRSLMSNDKVNLDAILQYTRKKARLLRKKQSREPLRVPKTDEEWNRYDVVIVGKSVDQLIDVGQLAQLTKFVREHGGTVIFSRGKAFDGNAGQDNELEPVVWGDRGSEKIRMEIGREGRSVPPFRILAENAGGMDALPELIAGRAVTDRKTLAATLADARGPDDAAPFPGMIHRQFGSGQVLSIAVDGLWRWSFNPKSAVTNNIFDRFWDQLLIWLVASGELMPTQQFAFRANTANLVLGDRIYFRLAARGVQQSLTQADVTIYLQDRQVAKTSLSAAASGGGDRLTGDFVPAQPGRYRAVVSLPDGKQQEVKFMVYEDNLEDTEVAADVSYLKALCESSGGRILSPDEFTRFAETLRRQDVELKPKVKLSSIWDRASLFYLIGACLGIDWYLRRKWGLC